LPIDETNIICQGENMRKVAVVGTGHSKFMFHSTKTSVEMLAEVSMDAINEANLTPKNIQSIFIGNGLGDFEEGQSTIQAYLTSDIGCLNVPATRVEGACASGSIAVREAFMWVASGFYDVVLVGGVERATAIGVPLATRAFTTFADSRYEYPTGFTYPAYFGMLCHLYSKKYGIPLPRLKELMAYVSVQSHEYAMKNPYAQIHKALTIKDVLDSVAISSPLQLHDCCPFTDGAAAVVLASEEMAKKLASKPIYIAGVGQASAGRISSQAKYYPRIWARELTARQAYSMAGLTPQDMDLCELHDCFSIAAIIASEGLGFFEYGTAGQAWERGETRLGGKIPINISGGLKAKGHPIGATGVAQVCEITYQLRGEMVDQGRQVEGAKYGITDTMGADGVVTNLILAT
jgi:acetyl-CoA C-acetyltransferase/acetyl-CoA acyltransferase